MPYLQIRTLLVKRKIEGDKGACFWFTFWNRICTKKIFGFVCSNHAILKWDIIKQKLFVSSKQLPQSNTRFALSLFPALIFEYRYSSKKAICFSKQDADTYFSKMVLAKRMLVSRLAHTRRDFLGCRTRLGKCFGLFCEQSNLSQDKNSVAWRVFVTKTTQLSTKKMKRNWFVS